jgi:diaminopimelate epimerase
VEVGEIETVQLGDERVELTAVSVGNPHAVVRGNPVREELLRLGPQLEVNERFPERTNVQLIRVDGTNELTVLVWERGAGETSASGSSAVAAAAAAVTNGWCESPVTVRMPGGELRVELDEQNRITLVGPAEEICDGDVRV